MTAPLPARVANLADAANRELAIREQLWPREVEAGRATRAEADADLDAWRELARLCAGQELPCRPGEQPADTLRRLFAVVSEAENRRADAVRSATPDKAQAREQRFADTWTLRRGLQRTAWVLGWDLDPQEKRKAA